MDLNAEMDHLIKTSQSWIPMIMEYGSRVLLALVTLAIGWWLINVLTQRVGRLLAMRNADMALQHFITSLYSRNVRNISHALIHADSPHKRRTPAADDNIRFACQKPRPAIGITHRYRGDTAVLVGIIGTSIAD